MAQVDPLLTVPPLLHAPPACTLVIPVGAEHSFAEQVKDVGVSVSARQVSDATFAVYPVRHCAAQVDPLLTVPPLLHAPPACTLAIPNGAEHSLAEQVKEVGVNVSARQASDATLAV